MEIDREYTAREVYGRLGRRVLRHKRMLALGVVCGMLAGGAWVPLFNMVPFFLGTLQQQQPAQGQVERPAKSQWLDVAERAAGKAGVAIQNEAGRPTWQFLLLSMMFAPLLLALKAGVTFFNHYALRWVGVQVVRDLRDDLFAHLQRQSLAFFGRMDVGVLMSRCTNDTATVDNVISVNVADLCRVPFEVAAALAFVAWFAVANQMAGLLLLLVAGFSLIVVPLSKISHKIRRWAQASMLRIAEVSSRMHENFTGIRVVKACHTEEAEAADFAARNARFARDALRATRFALLMEPVIEAASITLVAVFIVVCVVRGKTIVDIVPLIVPFFVVYKPVKQLSRIKASLDQGRAALGRVYSLLDIDTRLPEPANPARKTSFDTAIRFDNVSFAYAAGAGNVVANASFEIPKGRMVAVVGATGSGKTTLANLLARFYDPVSGRVTMDGVDLRDMAVADLRALVGVVTQETILFNTTVRENIAYGTPGATQAQIEAAARMANAHDFIMAHPGGYGRVCGEKGFVLSGGERQRVAIARAILKNPPILILDEATSALDTVTERQVQEAISRLMERRTVFAIAHRLSTVREAGLILVVERGVIVERGTHDELLALGGRYRGLCEMQQNERLET